MYKDMYKEITYTCPICKNKNTIQREVRENAWFGEFVFLSGGKCSCGFDLIHQANNCFNNMSMEDKMYHTSHVDKITTKCDTLDGRKVKFSWEEYKVVYFCMLCKISVRLDK